MTAKLARWETPFANAEFPSVVILVNRDPNDVYAYPVEVIVAPAGIDVYPKYRVEFGGVVAFSSMEEMHFPEIYFRDLQTDDDGKSCSYEFIDSPWLAAYRQGEYFLFNLDGGTSESLSHYVVFGGDDIVQVVTKNEPTISAIPHRTTFEIRFTI